MSEETVPVVEAKKRNRYPVEAAVFVAAWQAAVTTDEVAAKLSIPKEVVLSRANAYRKKGVALKEIARVKKEATPRKPRVKLDVDALNAIVQTTLAAPAE